MSETTPTRSIGWGDKYPLQTVFQKGNRYKRGEFSFFFAALNKPVARQKGDIILFTSRQTRRSKRCASSTGDGFTENTAPIDKIRSSHRRTEIDAPRSLTGGHIMQHCIKQPRTELQPFLAPFLEPCDREFINSSLPSQALYRDTCFAEINHRATSSR